MAFQKKNVETEHQIWNCYKKMMGLKEGCFRNFRQKLLLTNIGRDVILFNRFNNFVTNRTKTEIITAR